MMIVYRVISFLLLCLCSLLWGASMGLLVGVLIFGSTQSVFWLLSWEDIVLMLFGAVMGSGLGLYAARMIDAEWRRC
jgi:hypothetical protein